MAISSKVFGLCVTHPTNVAATPRVYVELREWMRPLELADKQNIFCLTADAVNQSEFDQYVDELIEQLQKMKKKAAQHFHDRAPKRR